MVPYNTIKIFTSKKSVNIQGVSQKAGPKRMDDIFEINVKLLKISSKTKKLTSFFERMIYFLFNELVTHE